LKLPEQDINMENIQKWIKNSNVKINLFDKTYLTISGIYFPRGNRVLNKIQIYKSPYRENYQNYVKKIRGQKSKNKINIDLNKINLNEYIKTNIIIINNQEYLIDINNILFTNDSNNLIMGRKIAENNYEWF